MPAAPPPLKRALRCAAILAVLLLAVPACRVRYEPPVAAGRERARLVDLALHLVGRPYRAGGDDIDGFDCSGFVSYVYGAFGHPLPRSAREQSRLKRRIPLGRAQPADILLFRLDGKWHSGLYLGAGRFVHAPSTGKSVRVVELDGYWRRALVAVIDRLG